MKIWVIMGNDDFPNAVRLSLEEADAYVEAKEKENVADVARGVGRYVHWRHYEFDAPDPKGWNVWNATHGHWAFSETYTLSDAHVLAEKLSKATPGWTYLVRMQP